MVYVTTIVAPRFLSVGEPAFFFRASLRRRQSYQPLPFPAMEGIAIWNGGVTHVAAAGTFSVCHGSFPFALVI